MFCGKNGDEGRVCVMPTDHSGECETLDCKKLFMTQSQKDDRRFINVMSDIFFVIDYLVIGRHVAA